MSDGDPYGYKTGPGSSQQYPQQGGYQGPQSGYPGPQGGYYQAPPFGQAQGYYQTGGPPPTQVYPGGPSMNSQGPPPMQYPGGRDQSGWGTGPSLNYSQGTSTRPAKSNEESDTRGLTDKLSSLMHRKSKEDDSSDSSGSERKDKKKKKKKRNDFNTIPDSDPKDGPYPFSIFCAKENPEMIVLEVADGGEGRDLLVGPNHTKKHPAYEILYDDQQDITLNRFEMPDLSPKKGVYAGRAELRNDGDDPALTSFYFPWLDWSTNVETGWWDSDAGLLQGKSYMKWVFLDAVNTHKTGRFAVRLFDTSTESIPTVATFYVDSFADGATEGRLEVVARLVRTYEQLDEIAVVAFAVMQYHQVDISDNMTE